jgi:hypothetical protein
MSVVTHHRFGVLVFSTAYLLCTANPLKACSCTIRSPAETFSLADSVFVGFPVSRSPTDTGWGPGYRYSFSYSWVWKGPNPVPAMVATSDAGACGKSLALGRLYLVYAGRTRLGYETGARSRIRLLEFSHSDLLFKLTGLNVGDIACFGGEFAFLVAFSLALRRRLNSRQSRPAA